MRLTYTHCSTLGAGFCFREDLDADEYNETRQDTIEQLKEFQQKLSRFSEGNLSLVDQFGATQLVSLNQCLLFS